MPDTTSAVDLDQLFALFDDDTKKGLKDVIRGSANQYDGAGKQANAGWRYLNPSFVASRRLFDELNRDTALFERFLVASSRLVTDVAERDNDLSALIDRLADTTGAIAAEEGSLSRAIAELPPFMRRANSTFVNLRAALDDLDPLLDESRPVTPKLRRVLAELRPFAISAKPVVTDLSKTIRQTGKDNDLIELGKATLPFRDQAIGPVTRNGKERPGSFADVDRLVQGLASPLRLPPPVQRRPDRLVRRLQPLRHLRRQRLGEPQRAHRQRVRGHQRRAAADPAGAPRAALPSDRRDRPAQPLPGLLRAPGA